MPALPGPTVFGWSSQPLRKCPRCGVRGRFKAAVGRGRRRRPLGLARSRQSAARGPAGAGEALPPPRASEEAVAEGGSPARAGARGEPPGSPAVRRPPGRFVPFRGWRCGRRCGPFRARPAALRCTRLHPGGGGLRLCVASVPTTRSGVTVCSGEVARHSDPSREGLAGAQTDSFDCNHPGVRTRQGDGLRGRVGALPA